MRIAENGKVASGVLLALGLAACQPEATAPEQTADEFIARLNRDFTAMHVEGAQAGWVQATYITPDTEAINARTNDRFLAYFNAAVEESRQFDGQPMSPATARAIALLRQGVSSPAPKDPALRAELTQLDARLEGAYGQARFCVTGASGCEGVDALGEKLGATRDYEEALNLWTGWHDQGAQMRRDYERFVELANQGARELGYADMGAMWRSGYDMPPEEFTAVTEKLWNQVKPLYEAMHCYTRAQLAKKYGDDKVRPGEPIPAHLLGNMWGQQWNKIYDDLLQPYPSVKVESADRALREQNWDAVRMTRSAESFYTSLGFEPLPATFWERSMLVRPRDRDVVCHASAWTIDTKQDVRIKMCMQPNEEELFTIYHELGHLYYDLSYNTLPYLFQGGAHDGFHEAIGDTVNLSVTPGYLAGIGLARAARPGKEAVINNQMKMAADKIAFLPFGKVIDEWRWKVFSGEIGPADYNRTWWEMRRQYQGIAPAEPRDESQFDAAAKYHVAANVPYTRYFLSYILQFQFHKALCEAAGFKGPLHECSVAGNKEAGAKLRAMLAAGQSEPWPVTLEKLTGTREMDASAIIEYFQPLIEWLAEQNKGRQCGWT